VIFPDIESLWTEWWQMKTAGHAVAAFQYAAALLYEADKNPVFAPWTKDEGGYQMHCIQDVFQWFQLHDSG
jgi:hypothetical protein